MCVRNEWLHFNLQALKDLRLLVPFLTDLIRNADRDDGYQLTVRILDNISTCQSHIIKRIVMAS